MTTINNYVIISSQVKWGEVRKMTYLERYRKLKTINEIMKTANAEMALAAVIDSREMPKIRDAADQAIKELEEKLSRRQK